MKRILFTTVLVLSVFITSFGSNPVIAQGQTNSEFGSYKIVALDDHAVINGKELDKYLISYEKPDKKVIVVVDRLSNCKKYYVLSGELAVQYKCNGKFFGIMKLDKEIEDKGFSTSLDILNKEAYFQQRVVASGTTETLDHLNLIASYYPSLYKQKVG